MCAYADANKKFKDKVKDENEQVVVDLKNDNCDNAVKELALRDTKEATAKALKEETSDL